jgi:hypothetical protein
MRKNKMPFEPKIDPKTGEPTNANDPTTWGSYAEAIEEYRRGVF